MRSRHSPEERRAICLYAVDHGTAAAGAKYGVKTGTVASWMHREGLHVDASLQADSLSKAVVAAKLTREQRVATLAESLLERAEAWLARLAEVEIPIADASEVKAIITAVAIAIDKSQLLAGGPTSRTEFGTPDEARERIAEMQGQWRARHRKAS